MADAVGKLIGRLDGLGSWDGGIGMEGQGLGGWDGVGWGGTLRPEPLKIRGRRVARRTPSERPRTWTQRPSASTCTACSSSEGAWD